MCFQSCSSENSLKQHTLSCICLSCTLHWHCSSWASVRQVEYATYILHYMLCVYVHCKFNFSLFTIAAAGQSSYATEQGQLLSYTYYQNGWKARTLGFGELRKNSSASSLANGALMIEIFF